MHSMDDINKSAISRFPKGHLLVIGLTLLLTIALVVASGKNEAAIPAPTQPAETPLAEMIAPPTTEGVVTADITSQEAPPAATSVSKEIHEEEDVATVNFTIISETVRNGDSLSAIFHRAGLNDAKLYEVIHSGKEAARLAKIYPGESFEFRIDKASGQLVELTHQINQLESGKAVLREGKYQYSQITLEPEVLYSFAQGQINDSLFLSALGAGLSEKLTMELAEIFAWDIDFILDIREGDHFAVVFEELYLNGERIGTGDIVAAAFTNQGKTHEAVRYEQEGATASYFSPDGRSLRKAFLRTPVDFARISSHFNLKRRHPVLHTIRAHKGTDYAAARGTPIRATGDGKVTFAGRKGGYGNVVILQHGQQYQTLYAHLDKFSKYARTGSRVSQGQIIGYVGSTGLATGPHLHYEFYVNGSVRNPVTVALPEAEPVAADEMAAFRQQTGHHLSRLANFMAASSSQVALAD